MVVPVRSNVMSGGQSGPVGGIPDRWVDHYVNEARSAPSLDDDSSNQLVMRCRAGDPSAAERIIQANRRLVVTIAEKYERPYREGGLRLFGLEPGSSPSASRRRLAQLIQCGEIGLRAAVDKFDVAKGFRFSTYASWYIRQAITRGIARESGGGGEGGIGGAGGAGVRQPLRPLPSSGAGSMALQPPV